MLLLFDAHKLDISDEFQEVIQAIREEDSKVRPENAMQSITAYLLPT